MEDKAATLTDAISSHTGETSLGATSSSTAQGPGGIELVPKPGNDPRDPLVS